MPRHAPEGLLEPLIRVLVRLGQLGHARDLADVDGPDPAAAVARLVPVHLGVRLRVGLGAVADADDLAPRQPAVDLLHPRHLVLLRAERQAGQEAAQRHPGRVAQDDGAERVVPRAEVVEEAVEIVRRGREVEPCWLEELVHVSVQLGHAGNDLWIVDKGGAKDAERRRRHGHFDGVVHVWAEIVKSKTLGNWDSDRHT